MPLVQVPSTSKISLSPWCHPFGLGNEMRLLRAWVMEIQAGRHEI